MRTVVLEHLEEGLGWSESGGRGWGGGTTERAEPGILTLQHWV